jgi:hypothetical protein
MERSYGYLSNFFQNKHFFITHIRDLHYKGLDVPSSIPRLFITPLYDVTKFMAKYYPIVGKPYSMPIISRLKYSPDLWQNITL